VDNDGDGVDECDVVPDCDDGDVNNFPSNAEVCDDADNDCDGSVSDAEVDNDGDGVDECDAVPDCDDADIDNFPGNPEVCDGADNDCADGVPTDETDDDGDGQAECEGDCDDGDIANFDGNAEICDGADNDCDGFVDDGMLGSGADCAGDDCVDLYDDGAPSGVYLIDPDGLGAYEVYCDNDLAGGGWQLISSRTADSGALFDTAICLDPAVDCSGHVPAAQLFTGEAPDVLFALRDGTVWLTVTGLDPTGSDHLLDVLSLDRALTTSTACGYPHYCGPDLDVGLVTLDSSAGYTPRFTTLDSQFSRYGGLWFGDNGGSSDDHVVSLNYYTYGCDAAATGGMHFSDASDGALGNVTCGEPGGIWFRY